MNLFIYLVALRFVAHCFEMQFKEITVNLFVISKYAFGELPGNYEIVLACTIQSNPPPPSLYREK